MAGEGELDETLKVDRLGATEGAVLDRLSGHSLQIGELRDQVASLRDAHDVGIVEIRTLVESAALLQEALCVPAEFLSRDALLQVGVPVNAIEQARKVVAAVTACKEAEDDSTDHLELPQLNAPLVLEDVEKILTTWGDLWQLDRHLKERPSDLGCSVNIGLEHHRMALGPLCQALLNRGIEMQSKLSKTATSDDGRGGQREAMEFFKRRLRRLCSQDWARRALESLGVEPPSGTFDDSEAGFLSARESRRTSGASTPPRPSAGARSCSPTPVAGRAPGRGSPPGPQENGFPPASRAAAASSSRSVSQTAAPSSARSASHTGASVSHRSAALSSPRSQPGKWTGAVGHEVGRPSLGSSMADLVLTSQPQQKPEAKDVGHHNMPIRQSEQYPASSPVPHLDCAAPDHISGGHRFISHDPLAQTAAFASGYDPCEAAAASKNHVTDAIDKRNGKGLSYSPRANEPGVNFDSVNQCLNDVEQAVAAVGSGTDAAGAAGAFSSGSDGASMLPMSDVLMAAESKKQAFRSEAFVGAAGPQQPFRSEVPGGADDTQQAFRSESFVPGDGASATSRPWQSVPAEALQESKRSSSEMRQRDGPAEEQRAARHLEEQQPRQQHPHATHPQPLDGPPELWRAVHVGDEATVTMLMQRGVVDGRMQDASGHTAFWHAVAFGHLSLAIMLLEALPPGTEGGVVVSEVHHRRGDTLLHLLCQSRPFSADTASVFKRVANVVPAAIFAHANAAGYSFLELAAQSLNFWVLKFVCLNHPGPTKMLVCGGQQDPLRCLADAMPRPSPPNFAAPDRIPEHFALVSLLSQNTLGRVPFADVAFDVGPEEGQGTASDRARFLAHRVVAGAHSSMLLEELERLPLQQLQHEGTNACIFRVDPRISKDVWRVVLQFMYSGVVACQFTEDVGNMVELFRACCLYRLPKPLLDFAQAALFQLLPGSPASFALQVLSVVANSTAGDDAAGNTRVIQEASAYILLRNAPQVFRGLPPTDLAKILERIFQIVEQAAFSASAARQQQRRSSQQRQQQTPQQPQQQAPHHMTAAAAAAGSGAGQQRHLPPEVLAQMQQQQQMQAAAGGAGSYHAGHPSGGYPGRWQAGGFPGQPPSRVGAA